ncbi:MAG: hypothetical protein A2918_00030 [Candidatus Yanofskybacteria bacterium RIFCSPLOWO2_01_FULL_42_49]|uniref:Uncharacterized protein n=1 Tax=Candidatus Yanofskybacteria bacterium RIFCSPLOWO2_01_FULL_42_49 TaxID=1802694 RepID=A0A1F8GAA2_9BACT|nr:MAG: hypothetical protein A2918_00030 [Candidatus Yanofskybacteria bacterium RIFCSPLOWO2_01_FULL_42_49]
MDELNQGQQQVADRIGELLAESPLDEDIKQVLLDGIERLPEHLLFKLLDVLENEREQLEAVAFEVQLFLKEQKNNWEKTAQDQQKAADTIIDAWVEKLK